MDKIFYQRLIKSIKSGQPTVRETAAAFGKQLALILKERPRDLEAELKHYFSAVNRYHRQFQKDPEPLILASVKVLFREARKKKIAPEELNARLIQSLLGFDEQANGAKGFGIADKRQEILQAALTLFSEKGYYQATMDEIAERGKLGKGTIYRYFSTKEDLLNELVMEKFATLRNEIYEQFDSSEDFVEVIRNIIRTYLDFFERDVNLHRIFIQEQPEFVAEYKAKYLLNILSHLPIIESKTSSYMQQGVIKKIDFYTLFYGIMGFLNGLLEKWFQSGCSYQLQRELPDVYEILFYGLLNQRK